MKKFYCGVAAGLVLGACLVKKCPVASKAVETAEDFCMDTVEKCKQKLAEAANNKKNKQPQSQNQNQGEFAQMYDMPEHSLDEANMQNDYAATQNQQENMQNMNDFNGY